MLTGKAPFTGENTLAVLEATVDSPAPDLELAGRKTPRRVVEILEQLLAKNPDDRYQSYDQFIMELTAARSHLLIKKYGSSE
jgi:serine/threonine-protein kinase